ncbi:RHS repeat domain-containing protein [Planctomycetaceae bacterium SH139]
MTGSSYGNGVSESRSYNTDNTLASISFSGVASRSRSYGWDHNKNKTSESITGTMSGFGFTVGSSGYDTEDRLVNWERSDTNLDQSWNLSLVGDWDSITENSSTQNRTHGPTNELLSAGGQSLSHDTKGNMTLIPAVLRDGTNSLTLNWDFANKLTTADVGSDSTIDATYKWDALGRRVYSDDGTSAYVYVQVGQQTIADYGAGIAASTPRYRYVYASYIDEPVLRYEPSATETLYYHSNQQYSIIALTDNTGAIAERYAYSAYGEPVFVSATGTVLADSAEDNRYTYTGREWDEGLGLYHFRARMYDSESGRFLGRDPLHYADSKGLTHAMLSLSGTDASGKCVLKRRGWKECCDTAWNDPDIPFPTKKRKKKGRPSAGMVICCDGRHVSCVRIRADRFKPEERKGAELYSQCVLVHENVHRKEQPQRPCPQEIPSLLRPDIPDGENYYQRECQAHARQLECLFTKANDCKGDRFCLSYLKRRAFGTTEFLRANNCDDFGYRYPQNWREYFE